MTRKKRRMLAIGVGLATLGIAIALILSAVKDSLVFFVSPTDVLAEHPAPGRALRLGGLVEDGSVHYGTDKSFVRFAVTDTTHTIMVEYKGLLPDLFREGQGVVTEGAFNPDGVFVATKVLAKHDETYMPKEVADALKASGRWQGGEQP